jgi:hypothetical protein
LIAIVFLYCFISAARYALRWRWCRWAWVSWLGGIMGFFNMQLNPANIMTLPLVIGIVSPMESIFSIATPKNRLGIWLVAQQSGAVSVNCHCGLWQPDLAKHQGIKSLGYVMSCGLATCMVAGLTFLPALLNLLTESLWTETPEPERTPGRRRTHLNTLTCKCRLSNICDVDVYISRPHVWAAKTECRLRGSRPGFRASAWRTGLSVAWNEQR